MANNYQLGKNFITSTNSDGAPTKYLDLQGLTDFWAKTKDYIDNKNSTLSDGVYEKIEDNDKAIREYVESLTVNGQELTITRDQASGLGTEMSVTINAGHIAVDYNGKDNNSSEQTIQSAITDVDSRLDAIQTELSEGVVSGLTVTPVHGEYGEPSAPKAWVDVTKLDDATSDVTITVDDTAINTKFKKVDEDIATLTANAGVTNIAVKDIDKEGGTNNQLVQISLEGTKDPVNPSSLLTGYEPRRGDILITLNETALDEKLDTISSTVDDEIADRKEDSLFLAGSNAEINDDDGKLTWKTTATQNYKDLTSVSTRLDEIDMNLVTKIEESAESKENFVKFTVTNAAAEGSNDNSVTLKIDDSALKEYTVKNEDNLRALNNLTINNKTVITATTATEGDSQVTVTGTSVVLTTEDIKRSSGKQLEEQLTEYDSKITALASATHFRGKYDSLEAAMNAIGDSLDYGDIIIVGLKEYIYNADPGTVTPDVAHWEELGDTTTENARITALEQWIDNNIISSDDIANLFNSVN